MKKKIVSLIIIAIISEIFAITSVFFILYRFLSKDTIVNAVDIDSNSTATLPAYNSIYGNRYSLPSDNKPGDIFYNIEAEIIIEKEKALIKETLNFITSPANNLNTIFLYVPSLNSSSTNIKNILSGEEILNYKIKGLMLEVEYEDHNNFSDSLTIEFEVLLNKSAGTISRSDKHIYLTNFLITPAVLNNGNPLIITKSSIGDPYIYDMNNYKINFLVDNNFSIYAPGIKEEKQANAGKKNITFKAIQLRDFPAVILIDGKTSNPIHDIQVEKVINTEIYFINTYKSEKFVKEAFLFASENIGTYPYDKLFIVEADMSLNGMEFSNMIFLSSDIFNSKEQLRRVTYHEIFHQWFYGIIGTDQVNEPFLDEGLVNYLAMHLTGNKLGNTYNNDFLKKNLSDYKSKSEYYNLAYDDAAVYFANIHQKLGNNFYKLLKTIYNDKKFSILYYNEFIEYLSMFSKGGK